MEWREIPGFQGYEASSAGQIRKTATQKILEFRPHKNGDMVTLSVNSVLGNYLVDRLISITFPEGEEVSPKRKSKAVRMIDKDTGETLKTFETAKKAAEFCGGKTASSITDVCNGKRKSAFGYSWAFN